MKRILNYFLGFFKALWGTIKRFNTIKGRISLVTSIMIIVGWAVVLVVFGFISKDARMIGVGSAVIAFWATPGPQSPMWGLIILLALIIQKFILFDRKAPTWRKIKEEFRPTWEETKAGINKVQDYVFSDNYPILVKKYIVLLAILVVIAISFSLK